MNYKIISKYIRKINFEIPSPQIFYLLSKNISNYKIKIDIQSNQIKEKIIEVQTTLALDPIKDNFEKINTQIIYSAIIELEGEINKKKMEEIILIKVPTEIYPDLRKIFIFTFANSSFKDIKIDKIVDFEKLYNLKKLQ
jgi:preprotein translocase subunit SecB|tara:strand:+ start:1727 stop:2143 length:417 start_codon:yes stop_codon:yes gene_type:complete